MIAKSTTVLCLLLALAVALVSALPTRGIDSVGMKSKKWYNWNDPQEVPSKKWYDWQDMPAADKMKRGGAFSGLSSAEMRNYNYHPENPFEFNFGRL